MVQTTVGATKWKGQLNGKDNRTIGTTNLVPFVFLIQKKNKEEL